MLLFWLCCSSVLLSRCFQFAYSIFPIVPLQLFCCLLWPANYSLAATPAEQPPRSTNLNRLFDRVWFVFCCCAYFLLFFCLHSIIVVVCCCCCFECNCCRCEREGQNSCVFVYNVGISARVCRVECLCLRLFSVCVFFVVLQIMQNHLSERTQPIVCNWWQCRQRPINAKRNKQTRKIKKRIRTTRRNKNKWKKPLMTDKMKQTITTTIIIIIIGK